MAIVFREGHLLLSVRYMVIIFQSIKRLYLAQLAACTKVKESDSPSSLWSRCILMKQMQRGASSPRSGTTEESYGSPAAPGSGSFGDINAKHKHAAALSIKVCASRLNSRRPSAVLLCYYSAGSSLREASCAWSFVQMPQVQTPEQRMFGFLKGESSTSQCTAN